MRIVIATVQVPFVRGGAEILVEDLRAALQARDHEVEIVAFPFEDWSSEDILNGILACRLLRATESARGPIDLLIGIKFPAYLIPHPRKVLWLVHQYRAVYELWHDRLGLVELADGRQVRESIRRADIQALRESRAVFTISNNVSHRLACFCGVDSEVLHPPPRNRDRFYCGRADGYFFFPSRISPLKRQGLVIEALAHCREPVRVRFAGAPDTEDCLDEVLALATDLGVEDRLDWLEWVTHDELVETYAHASAVLYPPKDEDYGYVTPEAMLASKPVITCSDSGGTLEFVVPGQTGVVAPPDPEALAAAMDDLWAHPVRARRWGRAGRERWDRMDIGWTKIVDSLLA